MPTYKRRRHSESECEEVQPRKQARQRSGRENDENEESYNRSHNRRKGKGRSEKEARPGQTLRALQHAGEYESIITEKDAEYASLLQKHEDQQASHKAEQARIIDQVVATSRAKEEKAAASMQRYKDEGTEANIKLQKLIQEVAALKSKAVRLQAAQKENAKLVSKVEEQRRGWEVSSAELRATKAELEQLRTVEDTYRLLTATDVEAKANGKFVCKLVKRNPYRVMEFELATGAEGEGDIVFKPLKIEMKGTEYPGYFKEKITFEPAQTPLLMRNLMSAVYCPEQDALPDQSQLLSPTASATPSRR